MHTKFVNARLWIGGKSASVKIKSRLHRQAVRCLFTWCMTGSAVCHVLYFFLPTFPCLPSSIGWKAFDFFFSCQLSNGSNEDKCFCGCNGCWCCVNDYYQLKNDQTSNSRFYRWMLLLLLFFRQQKIQIVFRMHRNHM